jgi:hypothetical protein
VVARKPCGLCIHSLLLLLALFANLMHVYPNKGWWTNKNYFMALENLNTTL